MAEISEKSEPAMMLDNRDDSSLEKDARIFESENRVGTVDISDVKDADIALGFLRSDGQEDMDALLMQVNEKKLVRKIDMLIMPLMFGCYFLQVCMTFPSLKNLR